MIIKFAIDRIEGDFAVLKFDDGKSIEWPKDKLPADIREGMILEINIEDDKTAEAEKKEMAKKILNEILDV